MPDGYIAKWRKAASDRPIPLQHNGAYSLCESSAVAEECQLRQDHNGYSDGGPTTRVHHHRL